MKSQHINLKFPHEISQNSISHVHSIPLFLAFLADVRSQRGHLQLQSWRLQCLRRHCDQFLRLQILHGATRPLACTLTCWLYMTCRFCGCLHADDARLSHWVRWNHGGCTCWIMLVVWPFACRSYRIISVLRSLILAWLFPCHFCAGIWLPTCWFEYLAIYCFLYVKSIPCCLHAGYNHRLLPFAKSVRRPLWKCIDGAMVLHFGLGCPSVAHSLLFPPISVPTNWEPDAAPREAASA